MLALCLMLLVAYYAYYHASIISQSLSMNKLPKYMLAPLN